MSVRTTIVIVSWNTRELLAACLTAVYATHAAARVVVVDNASADGTVETLSQAFPQATWVESGANLGFARGNNLALANVETEFVWLLNPDAEPQPGALWALEAALDAHPRTAVVGPALVNPDGSHQAGAFREPTLLSTACEWLFLPRPVARLRDWALRLGSLRHEGPVDWVLGAAMLVRTAAMREVGLLDAGYFMYAEELDWCRRFRAANWGVRVVPEATVMHHGGGATCQVREAMLGELFRSRARFFARTRGPLGLLAFRGAMTLGACWNVCYLGLRPQPGWHARLPFALAAAARAGSRDIA